MMTEEIEKTEVIEVDITERIEVKKENTEIEEIKQDIRVIEKVVIEMTTEREEMILKKRKKLKV